MKPCRAGKFRPPLPGMGWCLDVQCVRGTWAAGLRSNRQAYLNRGDVKT